MKSDDAYTLWICNCVATGLSILGTLWTCYYCLKIRSSGNVTLKLIIAITIADLLYTVANFISIFQTSSDTILCKIEAPIREISLRLTLYFSTCLSILIYKSSKFGIDFDQDLFFKRISIALFVIFLYLSSSSIFKDSLFTEFKDLNCHYAVVKEQTGVFKYLIATFYVGIPTAAGLLITLIAYILTFKRLRKLGQGAIQGMGIKPHKLFWYPAVLFLVFIPRIIDGLVKTFRNGEEIFFLKAMHMILTHSIGMANAVVYGLQMKYYYKKYEERDPFSSRLASFLNESLEVPEHNETMISSTRSKKK